MSKVKKILAMVLALAMVLGTTLTAFAADATTLADANVRGIRQSKDAVDADAVVTAYKIVELDQTSTTGYKDLTGIISDVKNPTTEELVAIDLAGLTSTLMTAGEVYSKGTDKVADYTAKLTPGMYLIKVTKTEYVYNPMTISVNLAGDIISVNDTVAKPEGTEITKVADKADAEIGENVTFTIESTIPSYGPEYTEDVKYIITDTLSKGLTYNNDATVVITGLKEGYSVPQVASNNQVLTAVFDPDLIKNHPGEMVTITYTAKVNENAVTNYNPNLNTVDLEYSNAPGKTDKSKSDKTRTYTFELNGNIFGDESNKYVDIYKTGKVVSGGTSTERLAGAEFALFTDADCKTQFAAAVTGADGLINFKGLKGNTEYYLKETKAPSGYSLSDAITKVEVLPVYLPDTTDGKGILQSYTITFNGTTVNSYTISYDGPETITKVDHTGDGIGIVNTELSNLPSTGGIGTTIFTIGGCIIMIGAAGLFFASRRKSAKK